MLGQFMGSQLTALRETLRTAGALPSGSGSGSHIHRVRLLCMTHEIRHLVEALRTQSAPIWSFVAVNVNVISQVALLVETLQTDVALEVLHRRVGLPVRNERRDAIEVFVADVAVERAILRVDDLMLAECRQLAECLSADFADEIPDVGVSGQMT